jgi:hypothetical protein
MSEEDLVWKGKIKAVGIFNFKDAYQYVYNSLIDEDYLVHETKYIEKVLKDGESKDVEAFWTATRTMSNYFKFQIKVQYLILGMKKVKVKRDDREVTMQSGSYEIRFNAVLIKDPGSKWENSLFKKFRRIYDRYIIKNRIEDHELRLYQQVNEIIANAKSFLAIEGQHNYFY